MADFTMGNGTFYRNGVNCGECDVLMTNSRESDVLTTHSLTSHFIGETSDAIASLTRRYVAPFRPICLPFRSVAEAPSFLRPRPPKAKVTNVVGEAWTSSAVHTYDRSRSRSRLLDQTD